MRRGRGRGCAWVGVGVGFWRGLGVAWVGVGGVGRGASAWVGVGSVGRGALAWVGVGGRGWAWAFGVGLRLPWLRVVGRFLTRVAAWGAGQEAKKAISRGGVRLVLPVKEGEL